MSVRVRLTRVGSKKNPVWRVVVADQRSPRDGRIIESLGHYNPQTDPSTIVIDRERLRHWIELGARPTNTVRKLMRAPDTVAEAVATETAPADEPAATPAPAQNDEPGADPAPEAGEGAPTPEAGEDAPTPDASAPDGESAAEPTTPEEGDAAPAGAAASDADAGPSGAAVEPSGEQETAPVDGEAPSDR